MNIANFCKKWMHRAPCFIRNYHAHETAPTLWDSTIPFKPPITGGRVIKVYDGDTITVASKLPYKKSPLYRWSVRIRGIDCPEMKTKNMEEHEIAKLAQETLQKMILNKEVKLENVTNDKYGRVLADVKYGKKDIGQFMITRRLALPYYGKTKVPPKSWKKYYEGKEHIEQLQHTTTKKNTKLKKSHTDHPKKTHIDKIGKPSVTREVMNHRIALNQIYLKKGMKPVYDESFSNDSYDESFEVL